MSKSELPNYIRHLIEYARSLYSHDRTSNGRPLTVPDDPPPGFQEEIQMNPEAEPWTAAETFPTGTSGGTPARPSMFKDFCNHAIRRNWDRLRLLAYANCGHFSMKQQVSDPYGRKMTCKMCELYVYTMLLTALTAFTNWS